MDVAAETTKKECDSAVKSMARVPFVGRLHLYLPQFPSKPFPYFSASSIPSSNALEHTPPPTPPVSEPEISIFKAKEEEVEPTILEEANETDETLSENFSTCSSRLRRRTNVDVNDQEELTANDGPLWGNGSQEYIALGLSFLFLVFERILRIITIALPAPIINFFYSKSRSLFNSFSAKRYTTVDSSRKEKNIVAKVRDADGFVDLCEIWNDGGYKVEEHVVQTVDGYLLGLHRVVKKTHEEMNRDPGTFRRRRGSECPNKGNGGKKVVYLHHGLLMNSEVWVCLLKKEQMLPFVLAEQGYDVWCGNNRGNKYSKKSIHFPSTSTKFWDFSMDDFAFYDIPDSINYILEATNQPSLSYIGFSQGTAQAFATLSIHPKLNEKIDVFIALAPAMSPAGLSNTVVDALMKASPNLIYLFFGRKSILSSTAFWQSILYPPIFVRVFDIAMDFLFKWECSNITLNQKLAAYTHLYSYTSVKSVVHWFQIIRNRCFQMYDDDIQPGITSFANRSFYKVAKFPTRNITAPIALVYGGCDSLVDIKVMLKELPPHTVATEINHFEHLDFLWGTGVEKLVFPHILDALNKHSASAEANTPTDSEFNTRSALLLKEPMKKTLEETPQDDPDGFLAYDSLAIYSDNGDILDSSVLKTLSKDTISELDAAPVIFEAPVLQEQTITATDVPEADIPEVDILEANGTQNVNVPDEDNESENNAPNENNIPERAKTAPSPDPITPPSRSVSQGHRSPTSKTGPRRIIFSSPSSPSSDPKARTRSPLAYMNTSPRVVARSTTPPGLNYAPPRGPAALKGAALTYDRPYDPMNYKGSRSGSIGSNPSAAGSVNGGGLIGSSGISIGSSKPISAVSTVTGSMSEHAGLESDAAVYPSSPSPPTAPRAQRSPPTGPRNPNYRRNAFSSNGSSPNNSGHYRESSGNGSDFGSGQGGGGRRGRRGRGRGRNAGGDAGVYRGKGERRMSRTGSLYSDNMTPGW